MPHSTSPFHQNINLLVRRIYELGYNDGVKFSQGKVFISIGGSPVNKEMAYLEQLDLLERGYDTRQRRVARWLKPGMTLHEAWETVFQSFELLSLNQSPTPRKDEVACGGCQRILPKAATSDGLCWQCVGQQTQPQPQPPEPQ